MTLSESTEELISNFTVTDGMVFHLLVQRLKTLEEVVDFINRNPFSDLSRINQEFSIEIRKIKEALG